MCRHYLRAEGIMRHGEPAGNGKAKVNEKEA